MTKAPSKGAQKRQRKRRDRATVHEVKAFEHGVKVTREVVGPEIWKKAVARALPIGFICGLAVGVAIGYFVLA